MMFPTFRTSATNVELTDERRTLIRKKLAPLGRLVNATSAPHFDIVMRKMHTGLTGDTYYVSVRMTVPSSQYYAIATSPYLSRALSKTRDDLRRTLSKVPTTSGHYSLRSFTPQPSH